MEGDADRERSRVYCTVGVCWKETQIESVLYCRGLLEGEQIESVLYCRGLLEGDTVRECIVL